MSTLSEVNKNLLAAQNAALLSPDIKPKDVAFLTKAISDSQKIVDSSGKEVLDDTQPYGWAFNEIGDLNYVLGPKILTVQVEMRRVVCAGNPNFGGSVYRYLHPEDSTKYEDGSDASADIAGANGRQVLVEIPRYYQRRYKVGSMVYRWMASQPFENSETETRFRKTGWVAGVLGTDPANEFEHAYVSAFENALYDDSAASFVDGTGDNDNTANVDLVNDRLASIVGFKPYSGLTRAEGRALIENNSSKQYSWHDHVMISMLFGVEYKTHNSQEALAGYTENPTFSYPNEVMKAGLTVTLGNDSGNISGSANHLAGGGDGGFSGVVANSYRGIENFYGHLYQWVEGINISNAQPYIAEIEATFVDDTFTGDYIRAKDENGIPITQPTTNGYLSKLFSSFFAQTIGATSATKITDYYYYASGNRVLRSGGNLSLGGFAGLSYLDAAYASSASFATICSR